MTNPRPLDSIQPRPKGRPAFNIHRATSTYEPISSVWQGSDSDLLEAMFKFYATIPPEPILDATYNSGRFWRGSRRRVVSMDIDPQYKTEIIGDNRKMTGVPSGKFGVVVYDPPHVGPQGRDKSKKRFDVDFGATVECGKEHDWNLSYLYPPFLKQAKRVLKGDGLLLAKITDMVNNHKSKWPHCDFMRMAEEVGFIVCDLIVKIRNGPMISTKWKEAHHARKRHCFWIICRNSDDCERRSSFGNKEKENDMTTFAIDRDNNIRAFASLDEAKAAHIAGAEYFSSQEELEHLASSWSPWGTHGRRSSKLIELWNSLPGTAPIKKFTDRQTALARIWEAAQALTARPVAPQHRSRFRE